MVTKKKRRLTMDIQAILGMTDHTLLRVGCKKEEIAQLCEDAVAYRCASVCIPPCFVPYAKECIGGRNGVDNLPMAILPVSTGRATMPTATGSTKINRKLKSQHGTPLWNVTKYFSVHGVQKRWPKVGWPESGACARNQMPNAKWIYNKIPKYTRVFVH